jgi:sugar phosphate isomerase/epimerase
MPLGYNRVLGDSRTPAATRPHRVAIAGWPTMTKDPRTETLPALLGHLSSSGYEGLEFSAGGFARYFPGDSPAVVASKARSAVEKAGLKVFGATLHLGDASLRKLRWLDGVVEEMKLIQDLGGEFSSFQYEIHPDYYNTGGLYREDEEYLKWCADTVATLRDKAWSMGLNFYLEVHVDRITEDPAALCRIMELAACELNGDMSHFLSRGFTKGKHVRKIQDALGHTHVRMARMYGDLSAAVDDPKADWESKGVTWQLFQFMKPSLAKGLSSRTISGETGPMHLVKNALAQDATLVPLYRAMARFADAGAQGIAVKVDEPGDLKPWG